MPDPTPGASIPLATLPNLRDLGGWRTGDGRQVRSRTLFRSTELSRLTGPDRQAFEALRIDTVYDFRSVAERTTEPDVGLDGVAEVALDVLADAPTAIPGNLTQVLSDPVVLAAAKAELGGQGVEQLMLASYHQLISLPSALDSYRRFYRGLLGEHEVPALFHCTTGKDRTGWAAASFLTLMGVPDEQVYREYLLTNDQLIPALEPVFTAFEQAGGNRALLLPVLGVRREYLGRAFAEVLDRFGSIEGYFADGLGVDANDQEELRQRYLTEPG
ncbi:MAG: tyrosine-protein phosphatase [Microlunatus sp.]|nr:tyrosine-protein phosphatase [Microlunatus sp.]MDN5771065.1 tyrosine-protein phosphatase [Microlunatus sp.]